MRTLLAFCAALSLAHGLRAEDPAPRGARPEPAAPLKEPAKDSFCVVGYLPYWETKAFDPAIGKYLTDVIYFSVEPKPDGELNHRDISRDVVEQLHKMREQHHTRIEIAVGGWGRAKAIGPVAIDPEKRKRFIESLAKYCEENKLDGVDFDWEFPRGKEETAAFGALLTECKAAFAPQHRLLTIAVSPSQKLPAEAIQAVDRVHLMSYDHGGASHSTLEQAEADIKQVLARGVPKNKLILGVPFYGRNPGGSPNEMSYAQIVARFHPAADANSASEFSFNGVETIRKKTRLAADQQLGGIMIWEIGQDTRDSSSLLRAIQAERENVLAESWDYVGPMKKVAAKFDGRPGVVVHIGDSITYSNPYGQWARGGQGKSEADKAILAWMHCVKDDDSDGWWLARFDHPSGGRSYTAAGGLRTDESLAGGKQGLPPLAKLLDEYRPQIVVYMLGTNDVSAGRSLAAYRADIQKSLDLILEHGIIPIVSTIPPHHANLEKSKSFNQAIREIAKARGLPLIDYEREILARRPDDWNGTLLNKNDVHPTAEHAGVNAAAAPTAENLRNSGYLLRGWLSVKKITEVKEKVIDPSPRP